MQLCEAGKNGVWWRLRVECMENFLLGAKAEKWKEVRGPELVGAGFEGMSRRGVKKRPSSTDRQSAPAARLRVCGVRASCPP